MQADIETLSALERRLDFVVPVATVENEVDSRVQKIARTIKMPGFRPGKVPIKLVKQQYAKRLREEIMRDQMQQRFAEVVQNNKLKVAGYPNIEVKSPAPGAADIEFSATFEVYPEVAVGDIGGMEITRPIVQVGPENIDKTITILRRQRATFEPVARPAQSGDEVSVDYTGTVDGEALPGGQAAGYRLVLGQGRMLDDFEQHVLGMSAGEAKTFELTFPQDYHAKNLVGKTATFTLKLHQVGQERLPEVDAAFAMALGIADGDLEKMRADIEHNLKREVDKRIKTRVKDQVMKTLMDVTPFELPRSLVEMEISLLQEATQKNMEAQGTAGRNVPLPPQFFAEQAERRVRLGLILAEVIGANKLAATDDQVRLMVDEYAESYEDPQEVVAWYYADPARLRSVQTAVVENNVVTWALTKVKVVDKAMHFDELMEAV